MFSKFFCEKILSFISFHLYLSIFSFIFYLLFHLLSCLFFFILSLLSSLIFSLIFSFIFLLSCLLSFVSPLLLIFSSLVLSLLFHLLLPSCLPQQKGKPCDRSSSSRAPFTRHRLLGATVAAAVLDTSRQANASRRNARANMPILRGGVERVSELPLQQRLASW